MSVTKIVISVIAIHQIVIQEAAPINTKIKEMELAGAKSIYSISRESAGQYVPMAIIQTKLQDHVKSVKNNAQNAPLWIAALNVRMATEGSEEYVLVKLDT